ncbi:hypothetical protein [Entomohabitans teleogrylli]|uniref:hypothetical protein n=1 Tax=Entomohabitans teleogrylli TaxID=1384589 RepID=UPI00073D6FB0|nr:hypothetical protein [Entomohabitans teleogrylli]
MTTIGSNTLRIIDKMVDFMASTQAFMEYLDKAPQIEDVLEKVPEDKVTFFMERLAHYRQVYVPENQNREESPENEE